MPAEVRANVAIVSGCMLRGRWDQKTRWPEVRHEIQVLFMNSTTWSFERLLWLQAHKTLYFAFVSILTLHQHRTKVSYGINLGGKARTI